MKDIGLYAARRLKQLRDNNRVIRCEICARLIEPWIDYQYVQGRGGYEHWYCSNCLISSDHKERRTERDRNNAEGNSV